MKKRSQEESQGGKTDSPDSPDSPLEGGEDTLTDLDHRVSAPDPNSSLRISEVRMRFPPDPSGPVVAYASCLINGCLALNDIRIERGRQSGLVIVYPSKPSSTGKRHATFNPVTREAGEALRQAFLGVLVRLLDSARSSDAGQSNEQ